MLDLHSVTKNFGGLKAVSEVSLRIEPGSLCGLIGPNGAGKTTLFNLITGVYPVSSGSIQFSGQNVTNLKPYKIARLGIARTFQNIRLFSTMSVWENVVAAQNIKAPSGVGSLFRFGGPTERRFQQRARELLEQMGLWERRFEQSASLPYGEQRRLEIARALALEPKLLLLDEPSAGMNEAETNDLLERIRTIQSMGATILLIEHDMNLVMGICDQVFVLNFGELIAQGPPVEIQKNDMVIEAYLGREDDSESAA